MTRFNISGINLGYCCHRDSNTIPVAAFYVLFTIEYGRGSHRSRWISSSFAYIAMSCGTQEVSMVGVHIANQENLATVVAVMPVRGLGSI